MRYHFYVTVALLTFTIAMLIAGLVDDNAVFFVLAIIGALLNLVYVEITR